MWPVSLRCQPPTPLIAPARARVRRCCARTQTSPGVATALAIERRVPSRRRRPRRAVPTAVIRGLGSRPSSPATTRPPPRFSHRSPSGIDAWGMDTVAAFFTAAMYQSGIGLPLDPLRACALYMRGGTDLLGHRTWFEQLNVTLARDAYNEVPEDQKGLCDSARHHRLRPSIRTGHVLPRARALGGVHVGERRGRGRGHVPRARETRAGWRGEGRRAGVPATAVHGARRSTAGARQPALRRDRDVGASLGHLLATGLDPGGDRRRRDAASGAGSPDRLGRPRRARQAARPALGGGRAERRRWKGRVGAADRTRCAQRVHPDQS